MTNWQDIRLGPYKLKANGLEISGKPSLAQAGAAGDWLAGVERLSQQALGVWYLDIRSRFPETYSQLLDADTLNEASLRNWGWVVERIPKKNWMLAEGVSFTAHQAVASLDPENQRKILTRARDRHLTVAEVKSAVAKIKRVPISSGQAELSGQFRILYCAPPFEDMSIEALAKIPVASHLRLNAAAFVWCPEPLRFDIKPLLEAWELTHKRAFIWNTQMHGGADAYLSTRHVHLLWCTRGKCPPDNPVPMRESIVSVRALDSGEKPPIFREMIDGLYDSGEVLELFAVREHPRPRWTFFGGNIGIAAKVA